MKFTLPDDILHSNVCMANVFTGKVLVGHFLLYSRDSNHLPLMIKSVPEEFRGYLEHYAVKDLIQDEELMKIVNAMSTGFHNHLKGVYPFPKHYSVNVQTISGF